MNPGESVVLVDPAYVGYAPILSALDVEPKIVEALAEHDFLPQLDAIKTAVDESTRVIFINTPANPTGAIMSREFLKELSEYCQQEDIWLVCDEVYSMFTSEKPHISVRTAATSTTNLVVIDGLSKSHAMSG